MKQSYNCLLPVITIEIDAGALIAIISAIIIISIYVGILEYRFRRLENHPFLKGLRQLEEEQMMDLARGLLKRGENNAN